MCSSLNVVNAIWSETLGGSAMQNMYIVYTCTLYSVHCASVQCTMYKCTLYSVQCTSVQCTLCNAGQSGKREVGGFLDALDPSLDGCSTTQRAALGGRMIIRIRIRAGYVGDG